MGSGQSAERASHFQNENARDELTDSDDDTPHISISTKMVERLVEDATVSGNTATEVPPAPNKAIVEKQTDYRDTVLNEKLLMLDQSHSEKIGLTVEEMKSTLKRIELRTANMMSVDPVCQDCAEKMMTCYETESNGTQAAKCADAVNAFTKCVQETALTRLRARTAKDAIEAARLTRHVAQARHHALKDLSIPPPEVTS